MSLGTARPLAAIRHGELVLISAGTSPRDQDRQPARGTPTHHRGARHRRPLRRQRPVPRLRERPAGLPRGALSLSYTSPSRPIVSLDDLSSLECALIGATATTKAIIASKGNSLRALPDDDLAAAVETIRAFADADLNVASAAERMHVHPNTVRYRLQQIATKTGSRPTHLRRPGRPASASSRSPTATGRPNAG